jgi:hypothetical protein
MTKNVLLIGRGLDVIDDIKERLDTPGIRLLGGTSIEDVRSTFARTSIDHVIMGAGLDLETRLDMVREIFKLGNTTTVHMNFPSGPQGFFPFVRAVLTGFEER